MAKGMKNFETKDVAFDKKKGIKESSKKDKSADKKAIKK